MISSLGDLDNAEVNTYSSIIASPITKIFLLSKLLNFLKIGKFGLFLNCF